MKLSHGPDKTRMLIFGDEKFTLSVYDAYFSFLIFGATFRENMGVATTRAPIPIGMGSPDPTTGWNFWANCYLEIMLSEFSGVNPL